MRRRRRLLPANLRAHLQGGRRRDRAKGGGGPRRALLGAGGGLRVGECACDGGAHSRVPALPELPLVVGVLRVVWQEEGELGIVLALLDHDLLEGATVANDKLHQLVNDACRERGRRKKRTETENVSIVIPPKTQVLINRVPCVSLSWGGATSGGGGEGGGAAGCAGGVGAPMASRLRLPLP